MLLVWFLVLVINSAEYAESADTRLGLYTGATLQQVLRCMGVVGGKKPPEQTKKEMFECNVNATGSTLKWDDPKVVKDLAAIKIYGVEKLKAIDPKIKEISDADIAAALEYEKTGVLPPESSTNGGNSSRSTNGAIINECCCFFFAGIVAWAVTLSKLL